MTLVICSFGIRLTVAGPLIFSFFDDESGCACIADPILPGGIDLEMSRAERLSHVWMAVAPLKTSPIDSRTMRPRKREVE
jgi:hypothetical protein